MNTCSTCKVEVVWGRKPNGDYSCPRCGFVGYINPDGRVIDKEQYPELFALFSRVKAPETTKPNGESK